MPLGCRRASSKIKQESVARLYHRIDDYHTGSIKVASVKGRNRQIVRRRGRCNPIARAAGVCATSGKVETVGVEPTSAVA